MHNGELEDITGVEGAAFTPTGTLAGNDEQLETVAIAV